MVLLVNLAFSFCSGISIPIRVLLAFKCYAKYEQNPIEMPVSLLFHNTRPNVALILPQTPHTLSFFFADLQWNMLGDSINTNKNW